MGQNEATHYEPPQQDLRCLQILLFLSLVLKLLNNIWYHTNYMVTNSTMYSMIQDLMVSKTLI